MIILVPLLLAQLTPVQEVPNSQPDFVVGSGVVSADTPINCSTNRNFILTKQILLAEDEANLKVLQELRESGMLSLVQNQELFKRELKALHTRQEIVVRNYAEYICKNLDRAPRSEQNITKDFN